MKRQVWTSLLSILLVLLIAAAVVMTGCTTPESTPEENGAGGETTNTAYGAEITARRELGEGAVTFTFTVVNAEKKATVYQIKTDATNLRGALIENGLIPEGKAGDLVNTVDGITADWSVDQGWWQLLANGSTDMLTYGVDDAKITAGADYAFVYTKGF